MPMATVPQIIISSFPLYDGFGKKPRNCFNVSRPKVASSQSQSILKLGTCMELRCSWLVGRGEGGNLVTDVGWKGKKRVVLVRFNEGFGGFNGGGGGGGGGRDDSSNARLLGNLVLAVGLTYLSMTGQLGWVLDAIVSIWLLAVLVPIVGLGTFIWWAGRDIVQSSCPNCGNDFQIFKSSLDDEVQLCPFCSQPFSVVDDKFVKEAVKFSNQTKKFEQEPNGFPFRPNKGKDYSTAVVDVEAEVKDVD